MRILQVVEPGKDGVFRHVENLTRYLIAQHNQVAVAYSSIRGSEGLRRFVSEICGSRGIAADLEVSNAPSLRDVRAAYRLAKLIERFQPDVVHAHSSKAGVLVRAVVPLISRAAIFYTPHAYFGLGAKKGLRGIFYNRIESLLGNIGNTINVSDDEASFARDTLNLSPDRQLKIKNAVDTKAFNLATDSDRESWREQHGLGPETLVLGTVGRWSAQKDYATLYAALAPILETRKEVVFAHLGEGEPDKATQINIQRLISRKQIIQITYLDRPASFTKALDGFILTSRYEGLSLAILEALACGLPLILSIAPGNREFMHLGLSHLWTAPPGDIDGFKAAISQWLSDIRARRPSNHRLVAEKYFSPEACYGSILRAYQQALPS